MASAGASSELRLRVVSSIVLATVALASAWIGGWLLVAVWLAAAIAVASEWLGLARVEPARPTLAVVALGLVAVQAAWVFAPAGLFAAVIAAAVAAIAIAGRTGRDKAWAVAGFLYAAPVAVVPVLLRWGEGGTVWPLLWMFAVVWTTDVAAYFVGRAVGGPRLWPAVSPKKTWSGSLGGLAGAVLAGSAVATLADTRGRIEVADGLAVVLLSALASVASQAGDLAESAMKRHFEAKDSGSLIPGHGGFLDRLDGFAAVAILVCLLMPLVHVSLWTVAP